MSSWPELREIQNVHINHVAEGFNEGLQCIALPIAPGTIGLYTLNDEFEIISTPREIALASQEPCRALSWFTSSRVSYIAIATASSVEIWDIARENTPTKCLQWKIDQQIYTVKWNPHRPLLSVQTNKGIHFVSPLSAMDGMIELPWAKNSKRMHCWNQTGTALAVYGN
ncbi:hypothetical protein THRCLA_00508 [Thraustotheca clavata]|uniref:Uncharacterized protein n=1 Tax=Thraustotheca clavata TaxID=74557 RepID=A0A1W0ABT8_9STRA|nr:hypothetical protein THRCLA_00508 [Thraustotheca clavata]